MNISDQSGILILSSVIVFRFSKPFDLNISGQSRILILFSVMVFRFLKLFGLDTSQSGGISIYMYSLLQFLWYIHTVFVSSYNFWNLFWKLSFIPFKRKVWIFLMVVPLISIFILLILIQEETFFSLYSSSSSSILYNKIHLKRE